MVEITSIAIITIVIQTGRLLGAPASPAHPYSHAQLVRSNNCDINYPTTQALDVSAALVSTTTSDQGSCVQLKPQWLSQNQNQGKIT